LNTVENLGKGWFSGVCVNDQGELNFTDPFTMENRPTNDNNDNNNIIGAVGSLNLDDSQAYYVIPETNNKFVEVLDNKGEIDSNFPLKDYQLHLNNISSNSDNSNKVSIKKYDDAVSIFIKNEIQKRSFLDLFEIYIEEKIKILDKLK
jgi:2-keto-3-deoxy-galactonokinase